MSMMWFIVLVAAATVAAQPKAGCPTTCGDLHIPYPFGTTQGCYKDEDFFINCDTSSAKPIANYSTTTIQVLDISLHGQLRLAGWLSWDCYNSNADHSWSFFWIRLGQFAISNTNNKFVVVGCDTYAFIDDFWGRRFTTGCTSICKSLDDVINATCSGIGCCYSSFPKGNMGYNVTLKSYNNHSQVLDFNPCSYGFVVEDGAYTFSSLDLINLRQRNDFPVVIDWGIGDENCSQATKNTTTYACMDNTVCVDSESAPGYFCTCKDGFQGNPYLSGSDGCQDIDECSNRTSNLCSQTCHNLYGTYTCSCLPGYKGNGFKNETGCVLEDKSNGFPVMQVALGITVSLLLLGIFISSLCWVQRKRKLIIIKKKFFEQNGGMLLQEQLSERIGYNDMAKLFSEEELKAATDNFHESKILGRGGQGTVYKGTLPDKRVVAIKKSRIADQNQVKDFINEVLLLSRINHRNVVKLLGCCLETEVPLLVYEYIPNNTLLHHIDPSMKLSCLPWKTRLRIAAETAGAISYLHSAASIPIIHRDIKSSNILLDHNYIAKVSDFGASRLVPLDQTQITTLVQGTLGYLDPEYLQTSQLTEKSDVYSFGVVLLELLTGKKVVEVNRPEEDRNLAMYFVSSMKKDRLFEVLDSRVVDEKNVGQLREVAILASRCIRVKGEERPTMKEVSMELEGLIAKEKHPWDGKNTNSEENEHLLGQIYGTGSGSTSNSMGFESMRNQVTFEMESGR
ncbi:putative wall-associated receptor kinase-like 16 [Senna tora]|uniref:Putative wall-associated receptor kinase-like 16 n=1 Tax=Senna tora TaxID=362788 RepID=A0A834TYP0_9FABA|nr:putative wall-associated receptor kinase-like 16 [Senna tora]